MRSLTAGILAALLAGTAGGQSRRSSAEAAAKAAKLVEEFTGRTELGKRTAQQLLEDHEKTLTYLVERMGDVRLSSRYRLAARDDLEALCLRAARPGAALDRSVVCGLLVRMLEGEAKDLPTATVVRMLEYVGGDESVGALAARLDDADPETRERARRALEANPAPGVNDELRKALFKAVKPSWRVGLVNALGCRRDEGSVSHFGKLLRDPDESVAVAAAVALGKIGTAEAMKALNDHRLLAMGTLRDEIADALFACAEQAMATGDRETALQVYRKAFENPLEPQRNRVRALRCLVTAEGEKATPMVVSLVNSGDKSILPVAMELAREIPGREATRAFAALLERAATADKKVTLLELLGSRGDPTARESVLGAIRGQKWAPQEKDSVRIAVIKALAGVGNESDVALLVRLATQDIKGKEEERKWAKWSLQRLRGRKVDEALMEVLAAADPATRREAVAALAARGVRDAVAPLLQILAEKDPLMRQAALDALGELGGEDTVGALAKYLNQAEDSSEVYRLERALVEICSRCDDEDVAAETLASAVKEENVRARAAVMRICGRLGGTRALEIVTAAARGGNADVRRYALQAMGHFRDVRAAEALLKIAASASKPELRTDAINSYLRLAAYLNEAPEKRLWMYLRVLDVALRAEEKKLILARFGDIKTLASMKLGMEHLDFPELRPTAEMVAYRVARHIYETHPQEVVAAMQRLIRTSENEETYKEAKRVLGLATEALKKASEKKP